MQPSVSYLNLSGSEQAPGPKSMSDELARLGELRLQGVLNEAEFAAAKAISL